MALEDASSVSAYMTTTECLIVDKPEEKKDAGMGGGMGNPQMGGMGSEQMGGGGMGGRGRKGRKKIIKGRNRKGRGGIIISILVQLE